jgi:hypothetical protein
MGISVFPTPTISNLPLGATSTVFQGLSSIGNYTYTSTVSAGTYQAYSLSSQQSYLYMPAISGTSGRISLTTGIPYIISNTGSEPNLELLTNWSSRSHLTNTSPNSTVWDGTTLWVKGQDPVVSFSTNGTTWATRAIPFLSTTASGGEANMIAYNAGVTNKFVALNVLTSANTGCVSTSTDGITWTGRTSVGTNNPAGAVINAATTNKYVMTNNAATSNMIFTSTDGVTWTGRTVNTNSRATTGYGATNGTASTNEIYVYSTVGTGTALVITSTNGVTWTSRTAANWTGVNTGSVTFGAGIYLLSAAANSGLYATSTNGVTWTSRSYPVAANGVNTLFNNGLFHTVSANSYMYSTDGITWTYKPYSICGTGGGMVIYAFSKDNGIATSSIFNTTPAYYALYNSTATLN